ncbi:MAG: EI24 domain-containing protein [Deltaproteobacteria bacterium]|nr:EI24 domain-containing protein [Deltaproteobacteria bacterium]
MSEILGPKPLPRGIITQLIRGALYPIDGLRFIVKQRLWHLAAAPTLIGSALFIILCVISFMFLLPHVSGWVADISAWAADSFWLSIVAILIRWLMWFIAIVLVLVVNVLLLMMIGQVLASTFLDILSERIETLILGSPSAPVTFQRMKTTVFLAIADLGWSLVYWCLFNLPILIIGLAAPPVAAVLSIMTSALLVAQEFVGLSLARRLVPFRQRWRWLRGHRLLCLGFGSTCMLLFAIPLLNFMLLPIAAVGGTLLFCDIEAAKRSASSKIK